MKKIVFIVLSGAAGKPCKSLGNKTPLEYADKPFIDSLFSQSVNGLMNVVGLNITPLSSVAIFALLGYNPFNAPSRGVLEAVGSGVDFKNGELAINCILTKVNKKGRVIVKRPRLNDKQGLEVERLINNGITLGRPFTFKYLKDDQAVLVIHDELSDKVVDTYPGFIRSRIGPDLLSVSEVKLKDCKPLNHESAETADLINDFVNQSSEVLVNAGLSINHLFTRGAGNSLPSLEPFSELNGFNMTLITDSAFELGAAKLLSMSVSKPVGGLPDLITNLLSSHQGVFLRIKSPDVYGHIGDAFSKVKQIEKIDKELFKPLVKKLDLSDCVVCVTSDHATPVCFGTHTNDPVPYFITGGEASGCFCEKDVNESFIEGRELMSKVKQLV